MDANLAYPSLFRSIDKGITLFIGLFFAIFMGCLSFTFNNQISVLIILLGTVALFAMGIFQGLDNMPRIYARQILAVHGEEQTTTLQRLKSACDEKVHQLVLQAYAEDHPFRVNWSFLYISGKHLMEYLEQKTAPKAMEPFTGRFVPPVLRQHLAENFLANQLTFLTGAATMARQLEAMKSEVLATIRHRLA